MGINPPGTVNAALYQSNYRNTITVLLYTRIRVRFIILWTVYTLYT